MKTALVTGITGQDAAYLTRFLLKQGYRVVGAYRRASSRNLDNLAFLGVPEIELVPFELLEFSNICRTIEKTQPDEVYNLAAQTHVGISFEQPIFTAEANGLGVARILEAIRTVNPAIKFYQASTSEMFGNAPSPQNEETPFRPRSPYGAAKLFAHNMTVNYREAHGLFACCGILFNHESPLRGKEFVTRKITHGLANGAKVELGNVKAERDWGFAGDYVEAMWMMMQADKPDDYVIATGAAHTVKDFWLEAVSCLGSHTPPSLRVAISEFRPADVQRLCGDASKAHSVLGWVPKTSFKALVQMMMDADLSAASNSPPPC